MYKSILISLIINIVFNIRSSLLQIEPNNQYYNPLEVHQPHYQPFGPQFGGQIGGQLGGPFTPYGGLAFSVGRQCDIRIESDPEFQKCRTEAIVDWGSTTYTDRQIKYLCCYNWDIVDCMETAVQYRCSRSEFDFEDYYKNFAVRKEEMRAFLERNQCYDYQYRSIKCHFFWWVIAIIVIVGFVIIFIIVAVCYRIFRKKSKKSRIVTTDVKVHK